MANTTSEKSESTKPEGRVLIIDDDDFMSGIFAVKLQKEGFEVEIASDGTSGLKKAAASLPDVILLDIMMPDITGFIVLRKLKARKKTAKIPVIMLTSLGQNADVKRALDDGAAAYVAKSHTTPADTIEEVRKAMSNRRLRSK